MPIWRAQVGTLNIVDWPIWRMGRRQMDKWPYITIKSIGVSPVTWWGVDDYTAVLHIDDERPGKREHAVGNPAGWADPGTLYQFHMFRATTDKAGMTEMSILPRTVACGSMNYEQNDTTFVALVVVDYEVGFMEDHEAWRQLIDRSCHDE